jgi:DNA-3-methyladenine glycosylase II
MQAIRDHLAADPVLRPLLDRFDLPDRSGPAEQAYPALVRSIIFQQLSVKAAGTIHGRFLDLFPTDHPDPNHLLNLSIEELRSAGLSRQKAHYVQNVARFFLKKKLLKETWDDHAPEAIIDHLTQIKGVGEWTVQMLLLGALRHPDVFPVRDQGIRVGMTQLYQLPKLPAKKLDKRLLAISEAWRPYRSYACFYIWQWKDNPPV